MASVHYRAVRKSFGKIDVLKGIDLEVADGEFVVLLGSSGSGKSTLLRLTAGLEVISGGDLLIDGERVNDVHPRERDTAMVFQNYALYPTMTVFDNIAFSLQVRKRPAAEIADKVRAVADVLGIGELLERYPKQLSGGQRQRVAMGRAMVREANVFLFDEPLSNLDAKLRAHMRVELRQLHERLQTTTIYVTHDQVEAMTMADKIVLLRDGAVEQVGTPDELFEAPATRYVADFIGTPAINILAGVLVGEGRPRVELPGGQLALNAVAPALAGERVDCGVRPSDLRLDDKGSLSAVVKLVERTGASENLHLRLGDGVAAVLSTDRCSGCRPGDAVRLSAPAPRLHFFARDSGRRIAVQAGPG